MRRTEISAFELAERFVDTNEVAGNVANPQILAMLRLDQEWPADDAVPWCSAFVNYIAWLLRLPRSKSLRARSWLLIGEPIELADAEIGFDVAVFARGLYRPGPEVIGAPGHVGFFAGAINSEVRLLGGNQADTVSIANYRKDSLLGIRRLK